MAKNTTQAEVVVTLNGQAARNELNRIEKEMQQYRDAAEEAYRAGNKALGDQMTKNAQRLEKEFKVAKKEMKDFSDTVKNMGTKSIKELEAAAKGLEKQLKTLSRKDPQWDQKKKQYQQVTRQLKEMKAEYKGVAKEEKALSGSFLKIGAAIGVAVAAVRKFAQAYKVIADFEQANANLATILGVNRNEMEELERAAMKLGGTTRYTASEVTSLQTELAKLGFTQKEIIDMAPATLNFATAVGTDLASAAQLAGVALRSFNLASDQTEDVLGTMAVACNKSALSFTYLQNAFSTIAPVAKTYGLSLKDTIALLGTLANAGFDASSAATATRNILLNLANANGKLATALGGTVNSFDEIITALVKLRDEGVDLNTTLELTDKRSVAAFNTFLSGAENARELRDALQDVNGELDRIATERMNTVEGAILSMQSAWERFILSFKGSTGTVSKTLNSITDAIRGVTALMDPEEAVGQDMEQQMAENIRDMYMKTLDPEAFQKYVDEQLDEYDKRINEAKNRLTREKVADVLSLGMRRITGQSNRGEARGQLTMLEGQREVFARLAGSETNNITLNFEQQLKQLKNVYDSEMADIDATDLQARAARTAQYEADRKAIIKAKAMEMQAAKDATQAEEDAGNKKHELTEKELAALKKAYLQKKTQLDSWHNYEEKQLKAQLLKGEISEEEYNSKLMEQKGQYYAKAMSLAKKYGQDETAITNKMMDDYIKRLEDEKKKLKEITEQLEKVNAARRKRTMEKEEAGMKAEGAARQQNQEAIEQNLAEAKALINDNKWKEEYDFEKWKLQQLYDLKMLSEKDLQDALFGLRVKYAQKAADQVASITQEASNFVNALKDAEAAHLEAVYQKELTDAGDNAEKREEIDAEYEKKQLELKKKYADTEMVINIAKTTASGAQAIMKAYAELGPVMGSIAAGIIAANTALEIGIIIAQRNAIKNSSVNSGGSAGASVSTGNRVISGYSTGGYTDSATSDHKAVGIVHANEWVAPAWMVRSNPVTFANLESYRKSGSHGRSGSAAKGFADGGYTGQQGGVEIYPADVEALVYAAISRAMADGTIRANVVYQDLKSKENQLGRFNSQTSR